MGAYAFNGINYWSVKISARDGYSGSPVYNEKGEVVFKHFGRVNTAELREEIEKVVKKGEKS